MFSTPPPMQINKSKSNFEVTQVEWEHTIRAAPVESSTRETMRSFHRSRHSDLHLRWFRLQLYCQAPRTVWTWRISFRYRQRLRDATGLDAGWGDFAEKIGWRRRWGGQQRGFRGSRRRRQRFFYGFNRNCTRLALSCHDISESIDRRAIDGPLRDSHLAQVGTGVAGQTFTVLKKFPTAFTAYFLWRFT